MYMTLLSPKHFTVTHITSKQIYFTQITSDHSTSLHLFALNPHFSSVACNYILNPLPKCVQFTGERSCWACRYLVPGFTALIWKEYLPTCSLFPSPMCYCCHVLVVLATSACAPHRLSIRIPPTHFCICVCCDVQQGQPLFHKAALTNGTL